MQTSSMKIIYFPQGQNERASSMSPEEMKCIVPNRYHMLFALLGKSSISIWHSKPCVEILCYTRPADQVEEQGNFMSAEWRADSLGFSYELISFQHFGRSRSDSFYA